MSSVEVKKKLHHYVDLADDRMAKALLAMFSDYFQNSEEQTVIYSTKNKPLTKSQMIEEVMDAVRDVQSGNAFSSNDIRDNLRKE